MLVYALGRVLSAENDGCVRVGWIGSHEMSTRACRPTSTGGTIVRIVRRIGCIERGTFRRGWGDDARKLAALSGREFRWVVALSHRWGRRREAVGRPMRSTDFLDRTPRIETDISCRANHALCPKSQL